MLSTYSSRLKTAHHNLTYTTATHGRTGQACDTSDGGCPIHFAHSTPTTRGMSEVSERECATCFPVTPFPSRAAATTTQHFCFVLLSRHLPPYRPPDTALFTILCALVRRTTNDACLRAWILSQRSRIAHSPIPVACHCARLFALRCGCRAPTGFTCQQVTHDDTPRLDSQDIDTPRSASADTYRLLQTHVLRVP